MKRILLLVALLPAFALATDKPSEPVKTQTQSQTQSQSQLTNANQANEQAQTVNAGGGQGGGASNNLDMDTTAIGVSTTAPIPLQMSGGVLPSCWLPTRARSYVFGIYSASSNYKRDEQCVRDLEAQRAHELALAQKEAIDTATVCSETVSRGVETCAAK